MHSTNANECFKHISAYFAGSPTGHMLLVNTENYDAYHSILDRLQADTGKRCIYVSGCIASNGLPDVDAAISACAGEDSFVLVGISQALMLRSESALKGALDELLERSISGHGVVLLDHCENILSSFMHRDIRTQNRIVLVDGERSTLPSITLVKPSETYIDAKPLSGFSKLLKYLENLTDYENTRHPRLAVVSAFPGRLFGNAKYFIADTDGVYAAIARRYSDIAHATERSYGTDEQWNWLALKINGYSSFSALICDCFGATVNLSTHIESVCESRDENQKWLLWLSLIVFGEKNNRYLTCVLKHTKAYTDFARHLYLDIIDIAIDEPEFESMLLERKRLIGQLPEDLILIRQYCDELGRLQKNAVFYLSDENETERYEFVRCLSIYDYTDDELMRALRLMSKPLWLYMREFQFDAVNTKVPEADTLFRGELTRYFDLYKRQKLVNRIYPDFLKTVDGYAHTRPYNKLPPRSSVIAHMDRKDTQLFFFDALGVEYLAFILAKCEEYGLVSEVAIAHADLPTITEKNKDFLQYYPDGDWCKIDALDDLKHGDQVINYEKCRLPIHIFDELEVIDDELRKIQSRLVQGTLKKAVIVADHGASRLAVLYGHEVAASLSLDESGEHSGRCCKTDTDPQIPCAAYENGYAVMADYERFKGGRKANVEVHGGASLEEVLVPIIALTKKPDKLNICFIDATITLTPKVTPELTLYSNVPLKKPRLCVSGEFIDGEFVADNKHAKFALPMIRRKGTYAADVYDGDKNLSVKLNFKVQKKTQERNLL